MFRFMCILLLSIAIIGFRQASISAQEQGQGSRRGTDAPKKPNAQSSKQRCTIINGIEVCEAIGICEEKKIECKAGCEEKYENGKDLAKCKAGCDTIC
jgi:hypothetical protein